MNADPPPTRPDVARTVRADHDALPAGTRFGEFEIIRVLGVGGFGIVYLAQDHSLERQVALKEYMPTALAARGAGPMITVRAGAFAETYAMGLRSFINEARLLARFDHPSLVKVYRFWEDNGTAYMVMPYLQGRTLRDARRAMAQPPDEAWIRGLLAPVLDALELLHREGVFHRDIAPDNILLPPEGVPILLDFGAARRVISDRTQSLTAILKPSYAPIEQYAEMAAMRQGPWTDLYALGAVLYYLLFGVPPAPATARAVQPDVDASEQIAQRIVTGVSPRFLSVVAWMLGVRPLERPQNVASLRAALNGELPIPSSVRHGITVSGDTALTPVEATAIEAPAFLPTMIESPREPTVRVEGSACAAQTQLDTVHQPTAPLTAPSLPPMTVAAPAEVTPTSTKTHAPGAAPMRSTPPGTKPPAYVPPARAPRAPGPSSESAPAQSLIVLPTVTATPSRRGLRVGGAAVALAVAAGVLWQFVSVINGQRQVAPSLAASGMAVSPVPAVSVAPAGPRTGPTVAQAASVPQWGAGLPGPDAVALEAVSAGPASRLADAYAATASAGGRAPSTPVAARTSEVQLEARTARLPEASRARTAASRVTSNRREPAAPRGPATAREACGDRRFIALAICIDRECERPRFRASAECVRVLEVKQRRAER